jgi:hypothetical protein
MSFVHRELALGRWHALSLLEQMGHIGSEVERALAWKKKNNPEYCLRAFERALELIDLTLESPGNRRRLREIARTREIVVDFFHGENEFRTSGESLSRYFLQFAMAARKGVAVEKAS